MKLGKKKSSFRNEGISAITNGNHDLNSDYLREPKMNAHKFKSPDQVARHINEINTDSAQFSRQLKQFHNNDSQI